MGAFYFERGTPVGNSASGATLHPTSIQEACATPGEPACFLSASLGVWAPWLWGGSTGVPFARRCQGRMTRIRQSRPNYGLGIQVSVCQPFQGVPSLLGSSDNIRCAGKSSMCENCRSDVTRALLRRNGKAQKPSWRRKRSRTGWIAKSGSSSSSTRRWALKNRSRVTAAETGFAALMIKGSVLVT